MEWTFRTHELNPLTIQVCNCILEEICEEVLTESSENHCALVEEQNEAFQSSSNLLYFLDSYVMDIERGHFIFVYLSYW